MLVIYIVASFPDALLIPEISLASFVCPWGVFEVPEIVIAKVPRSIGFQSDQGIFWFLSSNEDNPVDMVRPDVDRKKSPITFPACVTN